MLFLRPLAGVRLKIMARAVSFMALFLLVSTAAASDLHYCDQFANALGVGGINSDKLLMIARNPSTFANWTVYEGIFSSKSLKLQPPEKMEGKWPDLFNNSRFKMLYQDAKNVKAITMVKNTSKEIWFGTVNKSGSIINGVSYVPPHKVSTLELKIEMKTFKDIMWVSSSNALEFYILSDNNGASVSQMVVHEGSNGTYSATAKGTWQMCHKKSGEVDEIEFAALGFNCTSNGSSPFYIDQLGAAFAYKDTFFMFTNVSMMFFKLKSMANQGTAILGHIMFEKLCGKPFETTTTTHATTTTTSTTASSKPVTTTNVTTSKLTSIRSTTANHSSSISSSPGKTTNTISNSISNTVSNISIAPTTTESVPLLFIIAAIGAGMLVIVLAVICYCCCGKRGKSKDEPKKSVRSQSSHRLSLASKQSLQTLRSVHLSMKEKNSKGSQALTSHSSLASATKKEQLTMTKASAGITFSESLKVKDSLSSHSGHSLLKPKNQIKSIKECSQSTSLHPKKFMTSIYTSINKSVSR